MKPETDLFAKIRAAPMKFPECEVCKWRRSTVCSPCGSGEFFEERIRELSPDRDIRFRGSRNDD